MHLRIFNIKNNIFIVFWNNDAFYNYVCDFNKKQFILIKDLTKRHKKIIIWLRNAFIYSKRFKKDKHH